MPDGGVVLSALDVLLIHQLDQLRVFLPHLGPASEHLLIEPRFEIAELRVLFLLAVDELIGELPRRSQQLLRVFFLRDSFPDHPLSGADQPPQRRLFLDDSRVVLDVRHVRHAVEERRKVGGAARLLDRARAAQLLAERQNVDLRRALGQIRHRAVNPAVRVGKEVVLFEDRKDRGERGGLEQNRAEDGPFRFEVLRKPLLGG